MDQQDLNYCENCASSILGEWKGVHHKNVMPVLPKLENGQCGICDGTNILSNDKINWHNHHGPNSTGLPEYWLLKISDYRSKWRSPYLAEGVCKRCNNLSTISEMNYPNGTCELKLNCPRCGVLQFHESSGQQTAQGPRPPFQ